ncbi:deSI-like protein sdu1 isoform X2 [Amaranthus tricolor]|uniref:deSI-like protein sdu1 isoform X2 n=1 Tax=Amaranthus tricolor TaxID=29722 RepID=UPI00258BFE5B|nr:deSI-like protein sdu1 isoform X2 [Amaranthus tricolor]
MLCKMISKKKKTGVVPVYLNVYDLTPINGYAYWLGLGIYHSGVQVHEVEYAFGAHDHAKTGVFEVEPKHCPGFTFRKSILVGRTDMDAKEVRTLIEKLSKEYFGLLCKCVLPAALDETKVRHFRPENKTRVEVDQKKLRSQSSRLEPSNSNSSKLSGCSSNSASRSRRQRRCIPPSSSLVCAYPQPEAVS